MRDRSARNELERAAVEVLLAPLPVIPLDDGVARVAAPVRGNLRRQGPGIGFADARIAGTWLVTGSSLFTRNTRHFGRVSGLCIEPIHD